MRVWFQVKGKRASTLSLEAFAASDRVTTSVAVDDLRFWYAAPEPVYLAIYIEAADTFIAEDVREIVERRWPSGSFYSAVPSSQKEVTVAVDAATTLDDARIARMLSHRSMRIDGPSFRGRPLGHRFDPLRSQIDVCTPELFGRIVGRLVEAHDFRLANEVALGPGLTLHVGRFYQTFEWQSPAFSEYGFGPDDDFRDEPTVDFMHGPVVLIVDSTPARTDLADAELDALDDTLDAISDGAGIAVIFNGLELSSTGGAWRGRLRERIARVHVLGLESLTSLLLVATLVYLDLAPELTWRYVNYQ